MKPRIFSPSKIIIRKDEISLAKAFVDYLELNLIQNLSEECLKPLGLATGRTMDPVYRILSSRLKCWDPNKLSKLLKIWRSFNLDEYVGLSVEHTSSFRSYMLRNLAIPIGLNPNKVHIPNAEATDPVAESELYSAKLIKSGGIGLQILGLGLNGHIGFNEPPCSQFDKCRVVNLSTETRLQNKFSFGNNVSNVPIKAITLGLKEILDSQEIHLIVTGSSKSKILKKILAEPMSEKFPASWLGLHKQVFLWSDYSAINNYHKE